MMKDLSAHYEIARWIVAEMTETISPEEKNKLEAWLQEDDRHLAVYRNIQCRLEQGEEKEAFRNTGVYGQI